MTEPTPTSTERPQDVVLISNRDGVCTITLNRPAAFNSFNQEMKSLILPAVLQAADDPGVRVVVFTGNGRAFCAGQDLKEHLQNMTSNTEALAATVTGFYNPLITAVTGMRKPVLAAINGIAAGAGAALAFACDLRLAAASSSFTMAFAGVGLSADSGSSFTLPRLIGHGRATRMMLLGEKIGAAEALRIGMVDEVVDDDAFAGRTAELAAALADGPTTAYGWIKQSLAFGAVNDLAATLDYEDRAQAACFASADHAEAVTAFAEKRSPRFTG